MVASGICQHSLDRPAPTTEVKFSWLIHDSDQAVSGAVKFEELRISSDRNHSSQLHDVACYMV